MEDILKSIHSSLNVIVFFLGMIIGVLIIILLKIKR